MHRVLAIYSKNYIHILLTKKLQQALFQRDKVKNASNCMIYINLFYCCIVLLFDLTPVCEFI